jgi:hypothetical protein
MTTADTVAYHQERSHHFLNLVDDELARGELEEASNKVWGAAAHAIKAVAERRGWQHHAHALLEERGKCPTRFANPVYDRISVSPTFLRQST